MLAYGTRTHALMRLKTNRATPTHQAINTESKTQLKNPFASPVSVFRQNVTSCLEVAETPVQPRSDRVSTSQKFLLQLWCGWSKMRYPAFSSCEIIADLTGPHARHHQTWHCVCLRERGRERFFMLHTEQADSELEGQLILKRSLWYTTRTQYSCLTLILGLVEFACSFPKSSAGGSLLCWHWSEGVTDVIWQP